MTSDQEIEFLKKRLQRLENQNQGLKATCQQTLGIVRQLSLNLGDYQIKERCDRLIASLETMTQLSERRSK